MPLVLERKKKNRMKNQEGTMFWYLSLTTAILLTLIRYTVFSNSSADTIPTDTWGGTLHSEIRNWSARDICSLQSWCPMRRQFPWRNPCTCTLCHACIFVVRVFIIGKWIAEWSMSVWRSKLRLRKGRVSRGRGGGPHLHTQKVLAPRNTNP